MSNEYFQNILDLMQFKSQTFGNDTALSIPDGTDWKKCSYIELSNRTNNFSDFLRENGVVHGDRIAIRGESCPEWVVAFLGAIRAGAIVVPLDTRATSSELEMILQDCNPNVLISSDSFPPVELPKLTTYRFTEIPHLVPTNTLDGVDRMMDETAFVVYTSGTTGFPKGVKISFSNIVFQVDTITEIIGIGRDDLFLSILPMSHLLELTGGLFSVLYTGGEVCYSKSFYPQDVLELMKARPVTRMVTVPLFLTVLKSYIEKTGATLSNTFRGFVCGGARLDPPVLQFFLERKIPIFEGYGMTETSPVISVNGPGAYKIGSVGKPVPGIEVKISDQGEILTRGPHVMQGYFNRDDWTHEVIDAESWLHTGDTGMLDEDGYLSVTGRIKNLIVLGDGRKVHPEEVEIILENNPLWKEICVSAFSSRRSVLLGSEEVCALVVQANADEESVRKEIARLTQELPAYKRPVRILFRQEELPRTATKKIKRHLLRAWIDQQST
jgi:long-subunit acyl-CoA synthetase (AMP-forming)